MRFIKIIKNCNFRTQNVNTSENRTFTMRSVEMGIVDFSENTYFNMFSEIYFIVNDVSYKQSIQNFN